MKTIQTFLYTFILLFFSGNALMAQVQEDDSPIENIEEAGDEVERTLDEAIAFAENKFIFGIKAGLNFSTFNAAETLEPDFQTDFHLGAFGRYQWTQRISAKVELLFTSLGARADEFYTFSDYAIELDYLALPIMGEFMIADGLRLEAGPYVGVVVNSRQSFKGLQPLSDPNPNDGQKPTLDFSSDDTNSVDVGFMAGATYQLSEGLGVGFRYQQGFTDALGDEFLRDASGANAAFQLSFQFTF